MGTLTIGKFIGTYSLTLPIAGLSSFPLLMKMDVPLEHAFGERFILRHRTTFQSSSLFFPVFFSLFSSFPFSFFFLFVTFFISFFFFPFHRHFSLSSWILLRRQREIFEIDFVSKELLIQLISRNFFIINYK